MLPLEAALLKEADRLVGGPGAYLVIDDTAMPKKGRHSVGAAPQYASSLGKNANCKTLVSVNRDRPQAQLTPWPIRISARMKVNGISRKTLWVCLAHARLLFGLLR